MKINENMIAAALSASGIQELTLREPGNQILVVETPKNLSSQTNELKLKMI